MGLYKFKINFPVSGDRRQRATIHIIIASDDGGDDHDKNTSEVLLNLRPPHRKTKIIGQISLFQILQKINFLKK